MGNGFSWTWSCIDFFDVIDVNCSALLGGYLLSLCLANVTLLPPRPCKPVGYMGLMYGLLIQGFVISTKRMRLRQRALMRHMVNDRIP